MARYTFSEEQRVNGGKRGGKARARKLSKTKRREIAKRAAAARWNGNAK